MKLVAHLKKWIKEKEERLILFKPDFEAYPEFIQHIQKNDTQGLRNLYQSLSLKEKRWVWTQVYTKYTDFLSQIQNKEMLQCLIALGLDINRSVKSPFSTHHTNLTSKGPALFYVLAGTKNPDRFERFAWFVECGANVHAKDRLKESILKVLLKEFCACSYECPQNINISEKFLNAVELLDKKQYNFSELDPVHNDYVALDVIVPGNRYLATSHIELGPLYQFLIGKIKDINYARSKVFSEGLFDISGTFFVETIRTGLERPYLDILLEKYQDDYTQLKKFKEQLDTAPLSKDIPEDAIKKFMLYLERAELLHNTTITPPENLTSLSSSAATSILTLRKSKNEIDPSTPPEVPPKKKTFKI